MTLRESLEPLRRQTFDRVAPRGKVKNLFVPIVRLIATLITPFRHGFGRSKRLLFANKRGRSSSLGKETKRNYQQETTNNCETN
jgi:hypothetical protein